MIKGTKNWKKLNRFIKELDHRVDKIKRQTVLQVTNKAYDTVKDKAPKDDSQLGNYTNELSVRMVKGKAIRYGVLHSGKPENVSNLNPKKSLLFLKEIHPKRENRLNLVFQVLRKYEPFTMGMWPPGIPKDDHYVVYRDAKEGDVVAAQVKNQKNLGPMIEELKKLGVRLEKSDFPNNSVEAHRDVMHTVIQKELGVLVKPKPHWRPAIRAAKATDVLTAIKKDPAMMKALNDPDFKGWQSFGKVSQTVSEKEMQEVQRFQKLIMG